jgi:hypothetical protein
VLLSTVSDRDGISAFFGQVQRWLQMQAFGT